MSCASLWLFLTIQMPDLAFDSRISVGAVALFLSSISSCLSGFEAPNS
jgi:hypothetical protein